MRDGEPCDRSSDPWRASEYRLGSTTAGRVSCSSPSNWLAPQGNEDEPREVPPDWRHPSGSAMMLVPRLVPARPSEEDTRGPNHNGLDEAVGLVRRFPCPKDVTTSRFLVCLSEGVGEASITYHGTGSARVGRDPGAIQLERLMRFTNEDGELLIEALVQDELDRQSRNEQRALRRAKKEVRKFCVRWGLNMMWTFTFKTAQWDKKQVKAYMNEFLIRWRVLNGGKPFPYLYAIELHPEGHGYHIHVAVPGRMFTDFFRLRRVWGHGRIGFDKNKRHSGESRNDARRLATYLSKYLGKDLSEDHIKGEHRYEPAENFGVDTTRRWFPTFREADEYLRTRVSGENFVQVWSDYELEYWAGPPTWLYRSG
jgi:hypothetical protein